MPHDASTNIAPMKRKNKPGPKGTSCLTCKRRHKKCDQRLPKCERCEKGGFECLGYNYDSIRRSTTQPSSSQRRILAKSTEDHLSHSSGSSSGSPSIDLEWPEGGNNDHVGRHSALGSKSRNTHDELSLSTIRSASQLMSSPSSAFRKLVNFYTQLPCSPSDPLKTLLNNPLFGDYLLAQNKQLIHHRYFKIENGHKEFRNGVMSRLQDPAASFARWSVFIGMRICEAFLSGDVSQIQLHMRWIDHIEGTLKRQLSYDTSTHAQARERRSDLVHISLLKTLIADSSNTYQLLRTITPTYLQVVYSDPTLWPPDCNPTCIPLSNILCSEAHELTYFAFIDCACAMALGLPQQLEYDTTIYQWSGDSSSHQWVHGSPAEFQLALADINSCRDKSPNARDWREIEQRLLQWQSRPGEHIFTEAWMTVAWYAVQESWRLALLAYLYLAVCDVPSDDPRIQSCVKQMLQVVGTVKKHKSTGAEVSFLIQYLVAGICARSEVQRAMVRNALSGNRVTKFWIMSGPDFVPVMDHLWHGAAAGGQPVGWSDYMHSREAMLPVVV